MISSIFALASFVPISIAPKSQGYLYTRHIKKSTHRAFNFPSWSICSDISSMASCNMLVHLKSEYYSNSIPPNSTNLVFLLEAEDSGLLLNVDLLQVLPHLHHLAQKKTFLIFLHQDSSSCTATSCSFSLHYDSSSSPPCTEKN